jgi:TPR repeat protein
MWRDEGNSKRALAWFHRAVKLGNDDSNLDIAKHYLKERDPKKAIPFLNRVCRSDRVTEATSKKAKRLLRAATGKLR